MAEQSWLTQVAVAAQAAGPARDHGLFVPSDADPFASLLGLERVQESRPRIPRALSGVYLTGRDYLKPFFEGSGETYHAAAVIAQITSSHHRDELLVAVSNLIRWSEDPEAVAALAEALLTRFQPGLAQALSKALTGDETAEISEPRHLLFRPALLRTLRLVAEIAPGSESELGQRAQQQGMTPRPILALDAALLLSHAVADDLGAWTGPAAQAGYPATTPRLGGLPEPLAMEIVCNNLAGRSDNPGSALARTRLLWTDYATKLDRYPGRKPPMALLEDALGCTLDDTLLIAFAYYQVGLQAGSQGQVGWLPPPLGDIDVTETAWRAFLARFAQTPAELKTASAAAPHDWQMLSLQERPLLRSGDDVLITDPQLLIDRVTAGLFWFVHEYERDTAAAAHPTDPDAAKKAGDKAADAWRQTYSEMHELLAESYLQACAPALLDGSQAFFTEEAIDHAFPGPRRTKPKQPDIGIDFGTTVVLADAVSGQMSVAARTTGSAKAFRDDIERLVITKARQIDAASALLSRRPQPAASPLTGPAPHIHPVVIPGGAFATNTVVAHHVEERLEEEGLLQGNHFAPLAVLDVVDLEEAESVRVRDNTTLVAILDAWMNDPDFHRVSLSDYLAIRDQGRSDRGERPGILQPQLDAQFQIILNRVRKSAATLSSPASTA